MRLVGERVTLRPLARRDLPGLADMIRDERIYRYEPTYLPELGASPEIALDRLSRQTLDADRQWVLGVFVHMAPERLAGLAEFYDFKPSGKVVSIGYRLKPEVWGRGVGTDCVQTMLRFVRNDTGVELVTAHVMPDNLASARVLMKNGFELLLTKEEDWGHQQPVAADVYTLDCPRGTARP